MAERELWQLQSMQCAPLSVKVSMTKERIREWVNEYGEDGVYISFSGGKDSTVLLDIVRSMYPNIPAVYVDTGLEYPEIKEFVKTFDNVEILRPKMSFKQVIEKYGYPFFSKEVSQQIDEARNTKSEKLRAKRLNLGGGTGALPKRYWFAVLDNDKYEFSHKCCHVMKKNPSKKYEHDTGRKPITGMMAEESTLRRQSWLKHGCNAFDSKRPTSMPLSFWTEQDVLEYVRLNNLPICSVYGDIIEVEEEQLSLFDIEVPNKLKTTGCDRTGCVYCCYGAHLDKGESRFVRLKRTHPKLYEYVFKPVKEGGLGYKDLIDWVNSKTNFDIKY